jgi:tRNA A-37 threonylcarbamoyl transferase component Bud32/tetratricopeptide (TPR) repeat protein
MSSSPTDRYRRIDAVFDALLDLPPDEQMAYLDRTAGDDPELHGEVLRLLQAHRRSEGFLEAPVAPMARALFDAPELLAVGGAPDRIGPWRVVRAIGQGGMGIVLLGERADGQFEQRAAIKIIRHGTPRLLRRFLEERRILALLEHPGIARLIEGGLTPGGLPYFAMELIEGVPIDRYCDDHELSLDLRLELLAEVCDAVSYAHQHLVIHRDLKPSNILVTPAGRVKLLDFGIAKLLTDDAEGDRTGTQFQAMTPEFAAPEQVRGEAVSTATDAYALGVLLYLLLTGELPYDVRGKPMVEVARIVSEQEPSRPSSRAFDPLRRRLRGDLDLIVLTALQKEPKRRYQSPSALAEDLRRFREGRPISARPDTVPYRLGKFVRRNRTAVAAGGLGLAVLLTATVITTREMVDARRQRDEARAQRDRAVFQEQRATASSGFLETLLQSVAPGGRPYTTLELLGRARELLEGDFRTNPGFVARMMIDLSAHYAAIDNVGEELTLLARARELADRANDAETVAHAGCRLALLRAGRDELEEARRELEPAVQVLARLREPAVRARMQCLLARAQLAIANGPPDNALTLSRQAVALAETVGDTGSVAYADALATVSTQLHNQNRVREALVANRRVTAVLDRIGRGSTLPMLNARLDEARYLRDLGEMQSADSVLRHVVRLGQRIDPRYVAANVSILAGEIAIGLDRPDSAVAALELAVANAQLHRDGFREQWALERLVAVLVDRGSMARARTRMAQLTALIPERDRAMLRMLEARFAEARGDPASAYRIYLGALTERGFPDGRDIPPWHRIVFRAAGAALASGDAVAADSLARHALRLERQLGHDETRSGDMGLALVVLGRARLAQGDSLGGRNALARALGPLEFGLGPEHPQTRDARRLLEKGGP